MDVLGATAVVCDPEGSGVEACSCEEAAFVVDAAVAIVCGGFQSAVCSRCGGWFEWERVSDGFGKRGCFRDGSHVGFRSLREAVGSETNVRRLIGWRPECDTVAGLCGHWQDEQDSCSVDALLDRKTSMDVVLRRRSRWRWISVCCSRALAFRSLVVSFLYCVKRYFDAGRSRCAVL
jgi:hypothetical protein